MADPAVEIEAHKIRANAAGFSPDGAFLVSGGRDGLVKLWKPEEWELFSTFFGHRESVNDLSFDPRARFLVSSSEDRTVRVWSFPFGAEEGVREGLLSALVSPDGATVASLDRDDRVRLWSLEKARSLLRLEHSRPVAALAFEPDGTHLLAATARPELVRWRVGTGEAVERVPLGATPARLRFLDGGDRLAVSDRTGGIRIFETGGWECTLRIDTDADDHVAMTPVPGRAELVAAGPGRIRIFGTDEGRLIREIDVPGARVRAVACSPDGRWLVAAGGEGRIRVWERG